MREGWLGTRPQAVVELLKARRARPGAGSERKLALLVEGGGMRGVLSAGSLLALDKLGYRDCFDEVYATSAGAVNAAFFLSGQGEIGITVYFDCISGRKFIKPWRVTKIADVDYVYDHVVPRVKKLDEERIRRGTTDLFFSVTDVATGRGALLDVKGTRDSLARMLKASSALPVLYNRTVSIGGRAYVDGGLTCILPICQAVTRGCTDLLILLTRPDRYRTAQTGLVERVLLFLSMGWRYPQIMKANREKPAALNRERSLALGGRELEGVNVATICPSPEELVVGRTTTQRERLVEGAYLLMRKTARLLGDDAGPLETTFTPYWEPRGCEETLRT